jgi:hypothetical protein
VGAPVAPPARPPRPDDSSPHGHAHAHANGRALTQKIALTVSQTAVEYDDGSFVHFDPQVHGVRSDPKDERWLEEMVANQPRESAANMVFALVFEYTGKAAKQLPLVLPEVVNRLLGAEFQIQAHVSSRKDEVFVLIGLGHDTLVEEATFHMTHIPMMCRVKGEYPLRCTVPFHASLQHHLCDMDRTHDGTPAPGQFTFSSGQAQRLARNRLERELFDPQAKLSANSGGPEETLAAIRRACALAGPWSNINGVHVSKPMQQRRAGRAPKGLHDGFGFGAESTALETSWVASIMRWQLQEMLEAFGCTASRQEAVVGGRALGVTRAHNMAKLLPRCMQCYLALLKRVRG